MTVDLRLGVLIVAFVLPACGGARSTMIAHGTFAISCKRDPANCYDEASRVCGPQGFDIVDERERAAMAHAGGDNFVPVHEGDMLVRCRGAWQAAAPQCVPQGFACHAQTTCCFGLSCNGYANGWACGPMAPPTH